MAETVMMVIPGGGENSLLTKREKAAALSLHHDCWLIPAIALDASHAVVAQMELIAVLN